MLPRRLLSWYGLLACAIALGAVVIASLAAYRRAPAAPLPVEPTASPAALTVEGNLTPRTFVELSVVEPARIQSVLVTEGDWVEEGTVLVRLDGYEQARAELEAAQLEWVLARQALEELYRRAPVELALATVELRRAEKARDYASDHLASLQKTPSPQRIAQARANALLAEKRLAELRDDLQKASQKFRRLKDFMWYFVDRREYHLMLTAMEKQVALAERRYWDAQEKYEELLEPVDPIDLAMAQADLAVAEARLHQAERERAKLLNGPKEDDLEAARARLKLAQARLAAAQAALRTAQITTPLSGVVVKLKAKPEEFALPGRPLVVVADLSQWIVQISDLDEVTAARIFPDQPVELRLAAYPELELAGALESVSLYPREEEEEMVFRAHIRLERSDPRLRWGLTAQVFFHQP